ncbi:GTPase IMAP family member 6-like [Anabas testudineus]|nr:GTPase IMAP family member 6-like [Anabas testudineus]
MRLYCDVLNLEEVTHRLVGWQVSQCEQREGMLVRGVTRKCVSYSWSFSGTTSKMAECSGSTWQLRTPSCMAETVERSWRLGQWRDPEIPPSDQKARYWTGVSCLEAGGGAGWTPAKSPLHMEVAVYSVPAHEREEGRTVVQESRESASPVTSTCSSCHPNLGWPQTGCPAHGLRIVMFGKQDDKTTLGNFIVGRKVFSAPIFTSQKHCVSVKGEWRGKPVTVVKTPDMFYMFVEAVREEMKNCVTLCSPGPNVLLLLVKPSDFTEENRKSLKFILSLFGQDALKYSMVVITHNRKENESVKKLIKDCEQRQHRINLNKMFFFKNNEELMQKIEKIVTENNGGFLMINE